MIPEGLREWMHTAAVVIVGGVGVILTFVTKREFTEYKDAHERWSRDELNNIRGDLREIRDDIKLLLKK